MGTIVLFLILEKMLAVFHFYEDFRLSDCFWRIPMIKLKEGLGHLVHIPFQYRNFSNALNR